jgi:hypothetical protein
VILQSFKKLRLAFYFMQFSEVDKAFGLYRDFEGFRHQHQSFLRLVPEGTEKFKRPVRCFDRRSRATSDGMGNNG